MCLWRAAFVRAFQEADTNDAGLVAVTAIPALVRQVLGTISNHEMEEVESRVAERAHKGMYDTCFWTGITLLPGYPNFLSSCCCC